MKEYKNCKLCIFHKRIVTRSEGEPNYNTLDKLHEPQHKCVALGTMIDSLAVEKFNREGALPIGRKHHYDLVWAPPKGARQDIQVFHDVLDGQLVRRESYRNDDKAYGQKWNIYEDYSSSSYMSIGTMINMALRECAEQCSLFVNKQEGGCQKQCGECSAWKTCTSSKLTKMNKVEFREKMLEALQ